MAGDICRGPGCRSPSVVEVTDRGLTVGLCDPCWKRWARGKMPRWKQGTDPRQRRLTQFKERGATLKERAQEIKLAAKVPTRGFLCHKCGAHRGTQKRMVEHQRGDHRLGRTTFVRVRSPEGMRLLRLRAEALAGVR